MFLRCSVTPAGLLVVLSIVVIFFTSSSDCQKISATSSSSSSCADVAQLSKKITTNKNGMLVDEFNRVRIFHGFNDVQEAKVNYSQQAGFEPFLPKIVKNENNLRLLSSLGFNAIRTPAMWAAAQPTPEYASKIDVDYVSSLRNITRNMFDNYSIFSLLDMHQDVLSSFLGAYDGCPPWVVNASAASLEKSKHKFPWPLHLPLKNWALGYFAEETGVLFQDLYDNKYGGVDAWANFWQGMASEFFNESGILGYELINEPWAGNPYSHPSIMLPGKAGAKNLQNNYDQVAKAIRSVDNETLIFYEPVTWGMVRANKKNSAENEEVDEENSKTKSPGLLSSGFSHVPGGVEYADKSVFSFHYYCWFVALHPPSLAHVACKDGLGEDVFKAVKQDIGVLGGASMLTEFGADLTHPADLKITMDLADSYLQSWMFWDIQDLAWNGIINDTQLDIFVRPYAQAIAGVPSLMRYSTTSLSSSSSSSASNETVSVFELDFTYDPLISAPTEIALPPPRFPFGFDLFVEKVPDGANVQYCMCDGKENVLCLSVKESKDDVDSSDRSIKIKIVGRGAKQQQLDEEE